MAKLDLSGACKPLDDIFASTQQREEQRKAAIAKRIIEIELDQIDDFPEHPFKVRDDEDMANLVESIRERGVITPALVLRQDDGRYTMVSGHRRKHASALAGKTTIPCEIVELTHDEAVLQMVESNFQRSEILPSEKAFSYKMRLEAMKRQGQRADVTSRPVVGKSESADVLGEAGGDSGRQVQRYIRLTELIDPLLDMVDERKLAFRPAVEISYLSAKEQSWLLDCMDQEQTSPSLAQALKMKQFSKDGNLNFAVILSIMQEEKTEKSAQYRLPKKQFSCYFRADAKPEEITATIEKALKLYFENGGN